jgi:hypothetical protein
VYSYNDTNKSKVWSKVTNVFNKTVQKLYKVLVANDTIYTTPEHPFYTSKGWLQASALSIGMSLQTTNSFATLSNIKAIDTSATVYNFTVEGTHTYYVGNTNLLVHNTCQKHLGDLLKSLGNKSTDFLNDFANSPIILDKFVNGQLSIKAWEKFVSDGLPQTFRTNILNLKQRTIIDEWATNIANATNKQKGNFGEIGADLDLNAKNYESLMHNRIDDINISGHDGLDGVYRKNGQYFVVEGKYTGSASLNPADPSTGLQRQMSDDWIASRDWSEVNLSQTIVNGLIQNKNYTRILAKVHLDGTVTYRLIDSDGYAILGNAGIWTP